MSPYICKLIGETLWDQRNCVLPTPWLCITADFLAWVICQDVSENLKGYKDVSQWYLVVHDKMARILKVGVVLLISKWCFAASDLRHITPQRFHGQVSHGVEIKLITPNLYPFIIQGRSEIFYKYYPAENWNNWYCPPHKSN